MNRGFFRPHVGQRENAEAQMRFFMSGVCEQCLRTMLVSGSGPIRVADRGVIDDQAN